MSRHRQLCAMETSIWNNLTIQSHLQENTKERNISPEDYIKDKENHLMKFTNQNPIEYSQTHKKHPYPHIEFNTTIKTQNNKNHQFISDRTLDPTDIPYYQSVGQFLQAFPQTIETQVKKIHRHSLSNSIHFTDEVQYVESHDSSIKNIKERSLSNRYQKMKTRMIKNIENRIRVSPVSYSPIKDNLKETAHLQKRYENERRGRSQLIRDILIGVGQFAAFKH